MPSRVSGRLPHRLFLGYLALVLGYAVFENRVRVGWSISQFALGVAAVWFWLPSWSINPEPPLKPWLRWAIVLYPCYVALQLVPLPIPLVRILSPERAMIAEGLKSLTPTVGWVPLSVAPGTTAWYLFKTLGYTLTFVLIRSIAWRFWRRRHWTPVLPLLAVATMQAALGLSQASSGSEAHGTYSNRNHFAGLLEMALPLALAYALARIGGERPGTRSATGRSVKAAEALCAAGVLLVGLLDSSSKMGLVAGLCGAFVVGALAIAFRLRGWTRLIPVAGLAALCGFVFIFLPPDRVIGELGESISQGSPSNLEGRLPIWGDTLHLMKAYPLFGSGGGTYASVFPKFQTAQLDLSIPHAHNDYLEFATDLGIIGLPIVAVILAAVCWTALRAGTRSKDRDVRYLGLGCTGALAAILLHSTVDFNMYNRANPMVLAWIAGIAMCLADTGETRGPGSSTLFFPRIFATGLGCLLIAYASAWLVFEKSYLNNPRMEKSFCRLGICDTDALLAAQTPSGESPSSAPISELLEAVRRDSGSQIRWYYLCDALRRSGRHESVEYCFSHVLSLGPDIAPTLLGVADFYAGSQQKPRAFELAAHVLQDSSHEERVFAWFQEKGFSASRVMAVLPPGPRVARAYLGYLTESGSTADAATAWQWVLSHGYADDRLASRYGDFLIRNQQYEAAVQVWASYLGDRSDGYHISNWVFNGDFESVPLGSPFDWKIESAPGVETILDSTVAKIGSRSLRIRFTGAGNVSYHHVSQSVVVSPGTYRFEAYIRTQDLTTSQGIGFSISDAAETGRLSVQTEQIIGTNDWQKIERIIRVPLKTQLLDIRVVRPRVTLKFDTDISGTAWIDGVKMTKLS